MYRRRGFGFGSFLSGRMIAVLAVLVILAAIGIWQYAKTETVTFTVTGKESVAKNQGDHEYRVYTDQGTYKVTDSWVHPRFNASDIYGQIEEDKTYECKVYGWRFGLFSMFKNILECTEVNQQ